MKSTHPEKQKVQVSYYYMPAGHDRKAEIIQIINSDSWCIEVPTREEDLELFSFFQRIATVTEIAQFGTSQTWRIFTSWEALEEDHHLYQVDQDILAILMAHRGNYRLSEEIAA
ncbi:hypothetical protein [Pontibacter ruber]|uniref:Uncharacterized protein n=1 Tax=Pontibacter ruber TaxID=1343895 RepID=A0ABW5CXI0_9BACT|nr:hypothetical protein [Pontibacter ruber]